MMTYGPPYCAECRPIAEAELAVKREQNARRKAEQYNRRRDPKFQTFYRSKAWRDMSRAYLQQAGYKCEAHLSTECKGIAYEVHHVQPIQTPEGWGRRLDWSNLEAVCGVCHNLRHPEKLKKQTPEGVIDLRLIETTADTQGVGEILPRLMETTDTEACGVEKSPHN
jgi:5-methylcytosine-specific restriction endonuclease McrA